MKTNFVPLTGRTQRAIVATAAVVLLGASACLSQPFSSPIGTWDVVMKGPRDAVALMTFEADNTISMMEVLVPKAPPIPNSSGRGGDESRTGVSVITNSLPAHTNIFGWIEFPLSDITQTNSDGSVLDMHVGTPIAQWGFDVRGHVVGFFAELSPAILTTNLVPIGTNFVVVTTGPETVTNQVIFYLTNVTALRFTNAISFAAKVTEGKRLTAVLSTPDGKSTLTGLPPLPLPDISGSWYGVKKEQGLPYNELFDVSLFDPLFNLYEIDGNGPGYSYTGEAIVSRQNKIGLVISQDLDGDQDVSPGVNPIVRAEIGPVNLRHAKFTAKGIENSNGADDQRNTYQAERTGP